jgi:hypothetical protein
MRRLIAVAFLAFLALASYAADAPTPASPPQTPIPSEYLTLLNGLGQQVQELQRQVNAAKLKLETTLCQEAQLKPEDCTVNWAGGVYGKKAPAPAPAAQPKTSNF